MQVTNIGSPVGHGFLEDERCARCAFLGAGILAHAEGTRCAQILQRSGCTRATMLAVLKAGDVSV
jgi:hypothetical protein